MSAIQLQQIHDLMLPLHIALAACAASIILGVYWFIKGLRK